jgi:hypothetical protein
MCVSWRWYNDASLPRTWAPSAKVVQLRLRGGKRGRKSVVVGKKEKRESPWTHFTGGEAFGVDATKDIQLNARTRKEEHPGNIAPHRSRTNDRNANDAVVRNFGGVETSLMQVSASPYFDCRRA